MIHLWNDVHVVTVLAGSLLGFICTIQVPERIVKIIFQAKGLFTII
jgi:uncharacterized membrane protein YqgA involved in biofilm formation